MARAFYHYTITILEKVSFNHQLFKKELAKAYKSLQEHEKNELKIWLFHFLKNHKELHQFLINTKCFSGQELIIAS
jgi:hypothetical protein